MEEEGELNEEEGMSTPKKVATGAAVGLATAAAVGVGKKLIGSDDSDDGEAGRGEGSRSGATPSRARSGRTTRSAGSTGRARPRSGSSTRKRSRSTSGASSSRGEKTKEQLYAQAKRLKIEGRSRMTKAQLERAVQRARS